MMQVPGISPAFLSVEEQHELQFRGLRETLAYLAAHSPYYRDIFRQQRIDINAINQLQHLEDLPTTSKEDLQMHNQDFFCVAGQEICEYVATSGTLGKPVYIALTANDLSRLGYNEYRSFELMELSKEDTVQLMLTLDRQFMAGMAYYLGLKTMGAASVRTGPGLTQWQLDTAVQLGSTAFVAVPSFLNRVIAWAKEHDVNLATLPVRKVLCIGENIRDLDLHPNTLASQIISQWDLQLFSTYASTEMQTAFTECKHGKGGHLQPDLLITEILDEEGKTVKDGGYGEVTITHIGVEGTPLLRYRTGDICTAFYEACSCGRNSLRLSPVAGRKKQMIKYKGTTFYPPALFEILNQVNGIREYVVEVSELDLGTDELTIHVDSMLNAPDCDALLKPQLQSRLRIVPNIVYKSTDEIYAMQYPGANRKPIRFIDKRKTNEHAG